MILAPGPRILPSPLPLEGEVLTTGAPEKSPQAHFFFLTYQISLIQLILKTIFSLLDCTEKRWPFTSLRIMREYTYLT